MKQDESSLNFGLLSDGKHSLYIVYTLLLAFSNSDSSSRVNAMMLRHGSVASPEGDDPNEKR
jgi:hypothetical protein